MNELTASESVRLIEADEDLLVADLRSPEEFCQTHVAGSLPMHPSLVDGSMGDSLLPPGGRVLFLEAAEGNAAQGIPPASIAGREVLGWMRFAAEEWVEAGGSIDMVIAVEADELAMDLPFDDRLVVLDVRSAAAFAEGHVKGAVSIPLSTMPDPGSMAMVGENDNLYILGEDGHAGVLAAALLKRQGFHNLRIVEGGWEAVAKEGGIEKEKDAGRLN